VVGVVGITAAAAAADGGGGGVVWCGELHSNGDERNTAISR